MGRVWRPVRFFAEEDGVQKPTLLFLIFAVLIGVGAWAGGILIWRDVKSQRYADSILTRTPTATATITPTATVTLTPTITLTPSVVPTSTPYVYSDPATWELEEVINVHGEVVLDFTRAQKAQILRAFGEYYETAWRSLDQPPVLEEVLQYLTGDEYEFYQNTHYPETLRRGSYLLFPPFDEIGVVIVYSEAESRMKGTVCAKVIALHLDGWFSIMINSSTGEFINDSRWGQAELEYYLIYVDNVWKIYKNIIVRPD